MALVTKSTDVHYDANTARSAMRTPNLPDLVAGEALDAFAACYIASSDGQVYMCNATAANEAAEFLGITPEKVAAGDPVTLYGFPTVVKYGDDFSGDDSVSPGDRLYLAATDGRLDTAPTTGDPNGIAVALDNEHLMVLPPQLQTGSDELAYQDTQLASADVKGLMATNITLVDAPGANLAAIPVAVHLFLAHGGSNDFVQGAGTDHLALRYSASTEIAEIGSQAQVTTLIQASADAALYDTIAGGFVPEADTAIDLDNNGASEYTGNAANDNTLSVRVWYRIADMAAFS